jgi:hypothetical protein
VPQRASDFFAALYQLFFSLKIEQMFSTFCGGAVAQATPATSQNAPSSWQARRLQLETNLTELLENSCM